MLKEIERDFKIVLQSVKFRIRDGLRISDRVSVRVCVSVRVNINTSLRVSVRIRVLQTLQDFLIYFLFGDSKKRFWS